ncbi:MAG: helix-turn-helix domain-containing protein [Nitrospiraceae bacterium]|nr:helix-turn-helix domain-containing protein [Nitrospiraceae bacterium]
MTSIARLLKETIERTAKKQVRSETEALRKASARNRKTIADLGSRLKEMERELASIRRQMSSALPDDGKYDSDNHRFSAKGLQSLRKKLALSKKECGMLIGVSGRMIGTWESGQTRPTGEQVRSIAAIRNMGKREAQMRLEEKVST